MGEERLVEAEVEEEGYLTDLGERLPILEGCTNVCFTIRRRDVRGRSEEEQGSSQHWETSAQSSRINIDDLFPFPPSVFLS